MKRLKEKENPNPKVVLRTDMIREKALGELKSFAFYEAELLYKLLNGDYPNYSENEEVRIPANALNESVIIGTHKMLEVIVTLDEVIIAVDENGDEWDDTDLKLDDVIKIVENIEKTYNSKISVLE